MKTCGDCTYTSCQQACQEFSTDNTRLTDELEELKNAAYVSLCGAGCSPYHQLKADFTAAQERVKELEGQIASTERGVVEAFLILAEEYEGGKCELYDLIKSRYLGEK